MVNEEPLRVERSGPTSQGAIKMSKTLKRNDQRSFSIIFDYNKKELKPKLSKRMYSCAFYVVRYCRRKHVNYLKHFLVCGVGTFS